jgi:DNA-directed RNA polymerase specialized sigma24 family protein
MSVAEQVADFVPYLRRFARAVTCSQERGDACVVATLEAMLKDPAIFPGNLPPRIGLYRTFLSVVSDNGSLSAPGPGAAAHPGLDAIRRNLTALAPKARQAFLLVSVEEFSPEEAAQVLAIEPGELQRLLDEAGREIARQMATDVIIIEDEPLIALDLERLVSDLGHRVLKIVRTKDQAIEAVERMRPGLVLADIHLADGSSGLEAVNKILRTLSVPVIFITAYPQLLLTGVRPEPTFLITKPFHPDNVKAVISQALFLDIRGMPTEPHSATVA